LFCSSIEQYINIAYNETHEKWFLLKPNQKKITLTNLKNQNFYAYCPYATINNKIEVLFLDNFLYILMKHLTTGGLFDQQKVF
jgi:hypothetical protein